MALGAVSQTAKAGDHEVIVGFAIAESGWMSTYDGPPSRSAFMAIEDINAKGGILGKQIVFVTSDTKSDQTQGARAGAEVIAQGAHFVVVSCDYDMGGPAATVANNEGLVTFSLCASDAKMGSQGIGPYAFTMSNSSLTSGAVVAEWHTTRRTGAKATPEPERGSTIARPSWCASSSPRSRISPHGTACAQVRTPARALL